MANGKLTNEARTFVVQALACFDYPADVADAVKKEFGVEITKQAIEAYDPTKRAGKNLSRRWAMIFEDTRRAFLDRLISIPIAHRSVRLRAIQRMAERAERQKNYQLAAQLLEQAAKEVGDAYTSRRLLTGVNGGPIQTANSTEVNLSDSDAELVRRFLG
ncbi:DUF2280 domain-containing protein [Hyphomicrobium sp. ghe19]|uniref:DUF2280 domain-containing protein n=1 Tax=Hyphomicrobium sp. ghe19 TaxID=2682968 RepID=UPI001366FA35|nr:hypothetical protein HYPP_01871 [Hyphomicrobium sp. ghe19]